MKPLRILLVMIEPPLPFGNAAARWFYVLLKELVARGHRVTAFAACSKPEEIAKATALFPAPQYDLRLYPFPVRTGLRAKFDTLRRPYSYMFGDDLKADLTRELAGGCDVLHLEQLWSGWLGLGQREKVLLNVHYLFDIDLAATRPVGVPGLLERWAMMRAENYLVGSFPRLATFSDRLATRLREMAPRTEVSVVPLGIDTDLYPYISDASRTTDPVVSIIGNMGWYPSRSAAERLMTRLWPEISRRVPTARVQLVGWNAFKALARFAAPNVTILENVPDTAPYFAGTGVMLYAPGRGSGMKVKVLEAFGYGVPLVTTGEGVEGIPAVDGVHAGVCEDDAGLIDRTVKLLSDPISQNRQRAAGRVLLESHCGPQSTVDAVERIYEAMLRGPRGGGTDRPLPPK